MSRISVDCDLRRVHAWCSFCGEVCKKSPSIAPVVAHIALHQSMIFGTPMPEHRETPTVLFEIASPTSAKRGGENAGQQYQLARWSIWNVANATMLLATAGAKLLVAPSNLWTKGYALEDRHAIAKATASTKDLRECQTMLYFHTIHPKPWVPLAAYLESL